MSKPITADKLEKLKTSMEELLDLQNKQAQLQKDLWRAVNYEHAKQTYTAKDYLILERRVEGQILIDFFFKEVTTASEDRKWCLDLATYWKEKPDGSKVQLKYQDVKIVRVMADGKNRKVIHDSGNDKSTTYLRRDLQYWVD